MGIGHIDGCTNNLTSTSSFRIRKDVNSVLSHDPVEKLRSLHASSIGETPCQGRGALSPNSSLLLPCYQLQIAHRRARSVRSLPVPTPIPPIPTQTSDVSVAYAAFRRCLQSRRRLMRRHGMQGAGAKRTLSAWSVVYHFLFPHGAGSGPRLVCNFGHLV